MSLGENIKKLREAAGLTQCELAEEIGVTQNAVCKFESGTKLPGIVTCRNIARLFGVTLDYLCE